MVRVCIIIYFANSMVRVCKVLYFASFMVRVCKVVFSASSMVRVCKVVFTASSIVKVCKVLYFASSMVSIRIEYTPCVGWQPSLSLVHNEPQALLFLWAGWSTPVWGVWRGICLLLRPSKAAQERGGALFPLGDPRETSCWKMYGYF